MCSYACQARKSGLRWWQYEDRWFETNQLLARGFTLHVPWGERERETGGLISIGVSSQGILRRVSVIWSSPLNDHAKAVASNQYALPVLTYLMWTQTWPLAELQQIDRDTRKIISGSGGNRASWEHWPIDDNCKGIWREINEKRTPLLC